MCVPACPRAPAPPQSPAHRLRASRVSTQEYPMFVSTQSTPCVSTQSTPCACPRAPAPPQSPVQPPTDAAATARALFGMDAAAARASLCV
jgi:hypothetical protein